MSITSWGSCNQQEAFKDVVVEDQVDIEVLIVKANVPLTGDKGETLSQFEQESLQVVDNGLPNVFPRSAGVSGSPRNSDTIGD